MRQYKLKIIFFLVLLSLLSILIAEDVAVEAYVDRNQVAENEIFRLTIEVQASEIKNFEKPDLSKLPFEILNSSTSTSSSMTIINGKVNSQKSEKITYSLLSKDKGQKQIPTITVTVNGKKYVTNPISITITDKTSNTSNTNNRRQNSSNINNQDAFIIANVNKTNVFKNEEVIVSYKLYSPTSQISNISLGNEPSFSGFWKEDLYQPSRPQMQREIFNGKQYYTLLLRTIALFPSKDGNLVIPEMEIQIDVIIPSRSFFDFDSRRTLRLVSDPISLKVKPLPKYDNDINFINAVGQFDISSTISETSGEEGNSLTYKIIISGNGNYNQITLPQLPEIHGLRFLSPEISDEKSNSTTSFSGKRTFTYPIMLTEQGTSTIPQLKYSYFDPATKTYKTKTLKSINIEVKPSTQQILTTHNSQQSIRVFGKDIKFINLNPSTSNYKFPYQRLWFWFLIVFYLLSLVAHYLYNLDNKKLRSDLHYSRNRRANHIIRKYLKEAEKCVISKSNDFYDYAYQGLMHYLTDKLNMPRGVQEKEVLNELNNIGFSESIVSQVQSYLNILNMIKYANKEINAEKINNDALVLKQLVQSLLDEFNKHNKRGSK